MDLLYLIITITIIVTITIITIIFIIIITNIIIQLFNGGDLANAGIHIQVDILYLIIAIIFIIIIITILIITTYFNFVIQLVIIIGGLANAGIHIYAKAHCSRTPSLPITITQGGITCGAIDKSRKSSKAIDERVIMNFCDKNVVIVRFRDKNVVIALSIAILIYR